MSFRVRAQQFGSKLSGMVIPNLGAFMAWGIITAVAIAIDSDTLREFIGPMLNYLLPLLIAFAGGRAVHGYRGGVIATVATMGAILGADVTMFIGAMILGPLSAWILKQFDKVIDGKIPTGFELLVNNFSVGIFGAILTWLGYIGIAPFVSILTTILSAGVDILVKYSLLPLTAIFIEPAKILFLNNAIGQGILSPLGSTQLTEYGKSILYLLESNPGPGLGILLAYMIAGKGNTKGTAYGAGVIHFFGGIHEIYFPYVLMNPLLVLPLILGGITGTFLFSLFNVGLIGVASPGSILAILMMSAGGDHLQILISVLASATVTCLVAIPIVKRAKNNDSELQDAAAKMEQLKGKKSSISSVFNSTDVEALDYATISKIAYACDAGLGSSAMGANVLQKKIKKAGIDDVSVFHISISNLPTEADVIVTHQSLVERVAEKQPNTHCIAINDYLNDPEYVALVNKLVESRKKTG
ncbi:PTS mannitol transporter subunit IICB [Bacillus sp. FJAT-50079]|uniref:PTS mannitol transporter subunit IICB n=1 Tax=Bacillus sp. FJAT-50079 TaxID=2833577 RepID=UPI001BC9ECC5|nr:PTS mannitol transporter subunit IICB [Bacillus sp. FJAT-50079]MBS4206680.1 PTS mannitol transporter subunit IICB [Bacillus sp. FJAT-50079]